MKNVSEIFNMVGMLSPKVRISIEQKVEELWPSLNYGKIGKSHC
tara:strand:+ start:790 stop:921 length:132 start_codon:yes stop_codon:yes gene_type:complete